MKGGGKEGDQEDKFSGENENDFFLVCCNCSKVLTVLECWEEV